MTALARASTDSLPSATVVFVGHHQSGKSTAAGHIIVELGGLDKRALERVERETCNRPTSRYAWVLDRSRLERDRAMSLDLKLNRVVLPPHSATNNTNNTNTNTPTTIATTPGSGTGSGGGGAPRGSSQGAHPQAPGGGVAAATMAAADVSSEVSLTLIDTPGHPDYLRSAIAGITQADIAVLVVDSRPAVLESTSACLQTRNLAQLATTLASQRTLLVAVNHLDVAVEANPNLAEQRFKDATEAVRKLIKRQCQSATFIPFSALAGDNLVVPSPRLPWWGGPSLVGAIAAAVAATSSVARSTATATAGPAVLPLRMPVIGVYKVGGIGTVPAGRLAGGCLRRGAVAQLLPPPPLTLMPTADGDAPAALTALIRSLESFHDGRAVATAGEWVGLSVKGIPTWQLRRGCVISDATDRPTRLAARFTAKIQVLRDPTSKREGRSRCLRPGYVALVHVHTAQAPCRLVHVQRCDAKGEAVEAANPSESLGEGDIAEVELLPLIPLVVEPFRDYPGLGRFVVRAAVRTTDIGGGGGGGGGGGLASPGGGGGGGGSGGFAAAVMTPVIVALGRVESVTYAGSGATEPAQTAASAAAGQGSKDKVPAASEAGLGTEGTAGESSEKAAASLPVLGNTTTTKIANTNTAATATTTTAATAVAAEDKSSDGSSSAGGGCGVGSMGGDYSPPGLPRDEPARSDRIAFVTAGHADAIAVAAAYTSFILQDDDTNNTTDVDATSTRSSSGNIGIPIIDISNGRGAL